MYRNAEGRGITAANSRRRDKGTGTWRSKEQTGDRTRKPCRVKMGKELLTLHSA